MSYAIYDFTESLQRTIPASDVASVIAAWGQGNEAVGHCRHDEGTGTEWSGGFLVALTDGRFAYITGWCDYTGWGCQDGAEVHYFSEQPSIADIKGLKDVGDYSPDPAEWDIEPVDLNRWLKAERAPAAPLESLVARCRNYLGNGGLFNPELMEHEKVRDLILDVVTALEAAPVEPCELCHGVGVVDFNVVDDGPIRSRCSGCGGTGRAPAAPREPTR